MVLVALASLGLATGPGAGTGGGPEAVVERWVVGFHTLPSGLHLGGTYLDEPIVHLDEVLRFVEVETDDPDGFVSRAATDANVRYTEESELVLFVTPSPPVGVPHDPLTVEEDGLDATLFSANDPLFAMQYGPQQVRAPAAWDHSRGSTSAAVCIVDTGVRRSHHDIGTGRWLGWRDFVNNRAAPYDDHGHGTHVTGTAAAGLHNGTGIAGMGNVGIYGVKVLGADGFGSWSWIASGIRWCAERSNSRIVINLSLGSPTQPSTSSPMADAVAYADGRGRLLVASAGNGACANCVWWPARYPEVVAVGCVDGARVSCTFTSTGSQMELTGPGIDILSTGASSDTSYQRLSGTSMSAPHVSGALALAWSVNTSMSATDLRGRAQATAVPLGPPGRDSTYGFGLVDAKCLVTPTPHVPRTPAATAGPGAGQIRVTWTGPVWHCGAAVTGYQILRAATATGSFSVVGEVSGSTLAFTDSGLGNGVTRHYRVRAINANGASRDTATVSARTFRLPSAPTGVSAAPGPLVNQITVSWAPPTDDGGTPVTGYRVFRATSSTGSYTQRASLGSSARSWTDTDVLPATAYFYRVAAVNLVGVGTQSPTTCAEPFPSLDLRCP